MLSRGKLAYDPVQRWLLSVRESSRVVYRMWIERYLQWCKEDPESLLKKARDIVWLDDNLKSWYERVKKIGLASNTTRIGFHVVRSFFGWNSIPLPRSPRYVGLSSSYESDKIYTRGEIRAMLAHAKSKRDEAILLMLASCPQREGIICSLRWGMVAEQIANNRIPVVSVPAELLDARGVNCNKGAIPYRFAFFPEVSERILAMIEARKKAGENIKPDSWLFRSYSDKISRNPRRVSGSSTPAGPLSRRAVQVIIRRMASDAGLQQYVKTPKNIRAVFHPHGFRRYWKAAVRECWRKLRVPIDSDFLDYVLGHKLRYGGAYDKFSEGYIREVFTELEPFLSITGIPPPSAKTSASAPPPPGAFPSCGMVAKNEENIVALLISNQLKIAKLEEQLITLQRKHDNV